MQESGSSQFNGLSSTKVLGNCVISSIVQISDESLKAT